MPPSQPPSLQFQSAVSLAENTHAPAPIPSQAPAPSEPDCLPSLHKSLLGIQLPNQSHYCHHGGSMYFEPIPGCRLAPPQPYWFAAVLTTLKGIGIYFFLYSRFKAQYNLSVCGQTIPYDRRHEMWKMKILGFSNLVTTAVSAALLVHTCLEFDVPTYWEHYQCFGLVFTMAPWIPNALLVFAPLFVTWTLLTPEEFAKYVKDGAKKSANEEEQKMENVKETLSIKGCSSMMAFALNATLITIFIGPFVITNIWWAILCGGCIPLMCSICLIKQLKTQTTTLADLEKVERVVNRSPLVVIPGAILYGLAFQFMAAATAYFETGQDGFSFFESVAVAATERRSDVYIDNMEDTVLKHTTWLAEIINECWP